MREVNYNGSKIFIDDREVPVEETGVKTIENTEEELEKTREIKINLDEKDLLLDTVVDLWDDEHDNN